MTKLYVVVSWNADSPGVPDSPVRPSIGTFEDESQAAAVYRHASYVCDSVFFYVTDDSGRMDLILERERIPGRR